VSLDDSIPELTKKTIVTKDYIQWDENIKLPYKPFIGTISTSPELDSINSLTPGQHGGNMDLQYTAPGAKVYLPVKVEGAYLFLGDCHANQGDGEICGNAIEISSCTTIIVNLKKNWNIKWPRIENDEYIISVGSARPLEDAVRIAYGDLIDWMAADYDFDKLDAYMLLSQVGKLKLGNVVDPNYTVGAKIHKKYLKKN
jgi:acetamidase/formamidase